MKRKNLLLTTTIILFHLQGIAQITNTRVGDDLLLTRLYAGINSKIIIPMDSLETANNVSFRAGGEASLTLSNTFSINSIGVLQANSVRPTTSIATFEFITKLSKSFQLNIGQLPGPVTKLRPNPASWEGHSELYSQSRLVGAKPGAVLKFNPSPNFFVSYGVFMQNDVWTSQARLKIGNLVIAGYYQVNDEYLGVADFTKGKFKVTTNYSSQFNELALGCFIPVTEKVVVYTDSNYLFDIDESSVLRFGARHHFKAPEVFIKGFFGLEYDVQGEYFTTQLMIHL